MSLPHAHQCTICERHRPTRCMVKVSLFTWVDGRYSGMQTVTSPWCTACEDTASRRAGKETKQRILEEREALMMTTWDQRSLKDCAKCGSLLPDAIFKSVPCGPGMYYRFPNCIRCGGHARQAAIAKTKHRILSPYDYCRDLIISHTQRAFNQWTLNDHAAHSALMREMCSLPHHDPPERPIGERRTVHCPKAEAMWRRQMDVLLEQVGVTQQELRSMYTPLSA